MLFLCYNTNIQVFKIEKNNHSRMMESYEEFNLQRNVHMKHKKIVIKNKTRTYLGIYTHMNTISRLNIKL